MRLAFEAYRAGWSGDFRAADAYADDGAPDAALWRTALLAQRWLAQPQHGARADVDRIAPHMDRSPAVWAALEGLRAALLSYDEALANRFIALLCARTGESPDLRSHDPHDRLATTAAALAQAWSSLLAGHADRAVPFARMAGTIAAEDGHAPIVIEAMVVRALAGEVAGNLTEALADARRGSRMAAAESFPQSQYLANVVLARMRRITGAGHLATRILAALARVAPAPWAGWLGWEALMVGQMPASGPEPIASLAAMLHAAAAGDGPRFSAAATELAERAPRWEMLAADQSDLFAALHPDHPARESMNAWRIGRQNEIPHRLRDVCADPTRVGSPLAYVLVRPDGRAARVAARSARLWSASYAIDLDEAQGRTEVLLSTLALAGPEGVDRDRLFRSVYGFEYRPTVHRSVFKALVHRARVWLGDRGAIDHDAGPFVLRVREPILIADPRCEHPLEERMLRFLASVGGGGSAKDVAAGLGVPLRSVQGVLKNLVEDGAVQLDRRGRAIEYRVEDTTFSEPTRF